MFMLQLSLVPSYTACYSLQLGVHDLLIISTSPYLHRVSVHQAAKLVAALLRVAGVTAGLAESNGSLPPGL